MAKIYKAPKGFEAPTLSADNWQVEEQAYLERLAAEARRGSPGDPLVGEVVRFPMADSYAQYMVWSTKPLKLVHLDLGDAWHIPEAHARGLRLSDIQSSVDRDRAMKAMFAKARAERAAAAASSTS